MRVYEFIFVFASFYRMGEIKYASARECSTGMGPGNWAKKIYQKCWSNEKYYLCVNKETIEHMFNIQHAFVIANIIFRYTNLVSGLPKIYIHQGANDVGAKEC